VAAVTPTQDAMLGRLQTANAEEVETAWRKAYSQTDSSSESISLDKGPIERHPSHASSREF
jgi:hypothetical protein